MGESPKIPRLEAPKEEERKGSGVAFSRAGGASLGLRAWGLGAGVAAILGAAVFLSRTARDRRFAADFAQTLRDLAHEG